MRTQKQINKETCRKCNIILGPAGHAWSAYPAGKNHSVHKCKVTQWFGDMNHEHSSMPTARTETTHGPCLFNGYSSGCYHMVTRMSRVRALSVWLDAVCIYFSLPPSPCVEISFVSTSSMTTAMGTTAWPKKAARVLSTVHAACMCNIGCVACLLACFNHSSCVVILWPEVMSHILMMCR